MSLKQGTLVKYTATRHWELEAVISRRARRAADGRGAAFCYRNLGWPLNKIESNLIGIILETKENKQVKVRWLGINKTFSENEKYLEKIK